MPILPTLLRSQCINYLKKNHSCQNFFIINYFKKKSNINASSFMLPGASSRRFCGRQPGSTCSMLPPAVFVSAPAGHFDIASADAEQHGAVYAVGAGGAAAGAGGAAAAAGACGAAAAGAGGAAAAGTGGAAAAGTGGAAAAGAVAGAGWQLKLRVLVKLLLRVLVELLLRVLVELLLWVLLRVLELATLAPRPRALCRSQPWIKTTCFGPWPA